ncbi:MAG TPA: hypothetical protein VHF25_17120 [Nitriliruptorales bacterium]|nr:hypothetical protein [Nitriliruptorales bacterium]
MPGTPNESGNELVFTVPAEPEIVDGKVAVMAEYETGTSVELTVPIETS